MSRGAFLALIVGLLCTRPNPGNMPADGTCMVKFDCGGDTLGEAKADDGADFEPILGGGGIMVEGVMALGEVRDSCCDGETFMAVEA